MYTKFKGIRNFSFRNTRVTRKTCPMLTIKIDLPTSIWCLYSWIWTEFTHCSDVSIVDLDKVNARWVSLLKKFSLFFMKTIWTWPLIGRSFKLGDIFYKYKGEKKYHFFCQMYCSETSFHFSLEALSNSDWTHLHQLHENNRSYWETY